jgi:hypothetical protein
MPEISLRIRELEKLIEDSLRQIGLEGKQAGGDYFIAVAFNPGSQPGNG